MANIPVISEITKSLNKKGEIRGRSKKETKKLKAMCTHHKYNKKGKLKAAVFNTGDGYCICELCGKRFPTKLFDDNELKGIVHDMKTINEQAKYMAVAIGGGKEAIDYFAKTGVVLQSYQKNYKKIRFTAQKQSKIHGKNKKNHNRNGMGGSAQFGSWNIK